jgi:hypothetical protein
MSVKIIPRKRAPVDASALNTELLISTGNTSAKLANMVGIRLGICDKKLEDKIKQLRDEATLAKTTYVMEARNLYISLINAVTLVQYGEGDKKWSYEVKGQYHDDKPPRSLDYWAECNPAQFDAIKCIMTELEDGGWQPKLTLPDGVSLIDPETDEHIGSRNVILTCDFTELI